MRDLHDMADGALRQQAMDNLRERILAGKHKNGIFELLDSELNGERYKIRLEEIVQILLNADSPTDCYALAEKMRDGLIERYLTSHPELIEEEAAEIEAEEPEADPYAYLADAEEVGMA